MKRVYLFLQVFGIGIAFAVTAVGIVYGVIGTMEYFMSLFGSVALSLLAAYSCMAFLFALFVACWPEDTEDAQDES